MNRFTKISLSLAVLLFLSFALLYYIFNTRIKDQIIPQAKSFIQDRTELEIDFKDFRLSFGELLKLQPSIKITNFKLEEALKVKLILVKLNLLDFLQRRVTIDQVLLEGVDIALEENSQRIVHLCGLPPPKAAARTSSSKVNAVAPGLNPLDSLRLQNLQVKNSKLEFRPYGLAEAIEFKPVELELSNLIVSQEKNIRAHYKLSASVLNSSRSKLVAEGELGPITFDFKSLPLTGTQSFDFYLADLEPAQRKLLLGDLVLVKKQTAVHQQSEFSGDLMSQIKGSGKLKTNKLAIGTSEKHRLDILADLPHSYTLELARKPLLKLESLGASLNLKSQDQQTGTLSFDSYLQQELDTGLLQGSSHGKLSGLELREVLNSTTKYRDLIAGNFVIDEYHLYFKGHNADEINRSLKANGSLRITDGSLYILKSLSKYKDIAANLISTNHGEVLDKLGGEFTNLALKFELKNGNLITDPIALDAKAISITGSGKIKKGKDLNYHLALNVPGLASVPLGLKGTIQKPRVHPEFAKLGKQQGERLINGALKMGLDALIRHAK